MENKNGLTSDIKAIEKKQNSYINRYNKVIEKCNKSAWELAKVVYETVNADDFSEVFGTMTEYAKALNVSKSGLSKMARAYERKVALLETNEDFESYQLSHVEELAVIEVELISDFVEVEVLLPTDTVKTIREKVKHYTKEDVEEVTEEATEEVAEETDDNYDCMILTYKGTEYQIVTDDMINQIKELLQIED